LWRRFDLADPGLIASSLFLARLVDATHGNIGQ
jgi:hypothetical protein